MSVTGKRKKLRERLRRNEILVLPGAFNALAAKMIEKAGFEAVYISGAGLVNSLGQPDTGLVPLKEVLHEARWIAKATALPTLCDADTGFRDVGETVRAFEEAGFSALHIEDQALPKKCGHLPGKELIPTLEMTKKIKAAVAARKDPNFLIIARTDARSVEGLKHAVERARLYHAAGADLIFPEALESKAEFETFSRQVKAPLVVNMTEFGKSPLLKIQELEKLGYALVIFPMTLYRVGLKSMAEALEVLKDTGTQKTLLKKMLTRKELYSLLDYDGGTS